MGFPAAFTAPFANAMLTGSSLDYESDDITAETEIRLAGASLDTAGHAL